MINIEQIKERLTTEDIELLMGVAPTTVTPKQIIFPSICHHPFDYDKHKPKLYYYTETKSFYCFSCGFSGDIFSVIIRLRNVNFIEAVKYICHTCHINIDDLENNGEYDDWQKLKRFLKKGAADNSSELKIYDKSALNLFDKKYHQEWLDYGISKATMDLYNILWYAKTAQIVIPVYMNGELVGIRGRYTWRRDLDKGKYKPLTDTNDNTYSFPSSKVFYGLDINKAEIEKRKSVILVEAEKTVMKFHEWGVNNVLAVFGSNISKWHINTLLSMNVKTVILGFDSDFKMINDKDYVKFIEKTKKQIAKLNPYFAVEVMYNNIGANAYKFSPTDYSYDDYKKIYKNRIKIIM